MIYTIENNKYKIKVNSLGAELKSFLLEEEEYLHHGDKTYWHRSSPILFPIVGRLKNNNFKHNNKNHSLPIHGFARFEAFSLFLKTNEKLVFKLIENENTLKHYPFTFELTITYVLKESGLEIIYEVISQQDILFSLGAHPAFLLKAQIDDCSLNFEKSESQDAIALNVDDGCVCEEKRFNLSSDTLKLDKNTFENDALIFKETNSKYVTLNNRQNSKSVRVNYDGFEYIAFWAPVGAPFVCIEPWCGIADYSNTNHELKEKKGIVSLPKNKTFSKKLLISLNE